MTPPPIIKAVPRRLGARKIIAVLLSAFLALFLAEALLSVAGAALSLYGNPVLSGICGLMFWLTVFATLMVYFLMGFTPMIPKRVFLPLTLFNPIALFGLIPLLIYTQDQIPKADLLISVCKLLAGAGMVLWLHRFRFRLPLVADTHLGGRGFSWLNSIGFVLANLLVLIPATLFYLF